MTNYVAGWNLSPYAPDPDNLWITRDYGAGVEYLLETLERWSDSDAELNDYDHDEYLLAVSEIEGQRTNGAEVSAMYRGMHLWVTTTSEEPEDE
jgi:hypothetical protein